MVNNFVGLFLPTTVGEDISRTITLGHYISNSADAASSIVVDRIIGLMTLISVAVVSAVLVTDIQLPRMVIYAIAIAIIGLAGLLIVFSSRSLSLRLKKLNPRFEGNIVFRKLRRFGKSIAMYGDHKGVLARVSLISVGAQGLRVLIVYSASLSLNLDVSMYYFFLFVPLIIFITMLPISIGGIGVREGAYVYFFSHVGVAMHSAFMLSLLSYSLILVAAIPGGLLYGLIGFPKSAR